MSGQKRLFRLIAPIALIMVVASVAGPVGAASSSKLYTAEISAVPDGDGNLEITVTITNSPLSSAVLGSATITLTGFTNITDISIPEASNDKPWTASPSGVVIKLRTTDGGKLSPGESVSVSFTATPPTGEGSYTIGTAAKTSRDFTGSGNFKLLGSNPVFVVCPDDDVCTASLGNPNNATPDHQSGKLTTNDTCDGCTLFIWETLADFCSTSPPASCQTTFTPGYLIVSSLGVNYTFTLTCDAVDCPTGPFYSVWWDQNTGPTTGSDDVTEIMDFCDEDSYIFPPCLISQTTLGNGDLQSILSLEQSEESLDPKIAH